MNLYVGGAGQGKTEYVLRKLQTEPVVIPGKDLNDWLQKEQKKRSTAIPEHVSVFQNAQCEKTFNHSVVITHLEAYTRNALQEMQDKENPEIAFSSTICTQLDAFIQRHPNISIICNEIGNGIVPMDPEERLWREVTGRVLIHLAKEANHFERVIAGMGQVIK